MNYLNGKCKHITRFEGTGYSLEIYDDQGMDISGGDVWVYTPKHCPECGCSLLETGEKLNLKKDE